MFVLFVNSFSNKQNPLKDKNLVFIQAVFNAFFLFKAVIFSIKFLLSFYIYMRMEQKKYDLLFAVE